MSLTTDVIHVVCAQAVGPVAVTSLLLGEGLPKVVGLPEQEDPNTPEHPEIQAIYNRTAIQACPCCVYIPRCSFQPSTQHASKKNVQG